MAAGRPGSDIEIQADEPIPAYRSVSPRGSGRGVVVFHEAWGLVDQVRDVCDRLAREGFVALAPDLFRGRSGQTPEEAAELMGGLEIARVGADADGAVAALLNDDRVDGSRVGALGFCMGGAVALFAGTRNARIGAVVDCYGILPDFPLALEDLKAPVLGLFGSEDEFISQQEIRGLELSLRAHSPRSTLRCYAGVGHAFMNESRPDRYDARAAADAWQALLAFLRTELA